MTSEAAHYDFNWEEPLPHSLPPRRTYLSEPGPQTKCVLLLLHGRGDNAADFSDIFVNAFQQAFPDDAQKQISIVALEARDTAWWPAHHEGEKPCLHVSAYLLTGVLTAHTATDDASYEFNAPYVWSALHRLHQELVGLDAEGIPPKRVVIAGFSQGAILANTYLQSLLDEPTADHRSLLLPRHILALSGTVFSRRAPFPSGRKFGDAAEEEEWNRRGGLETVKEPGHICEVQLLCGDNDRHFTSEQVYAAQEELKRCYGNSILKDRLEIKVTAQIETGLLHIVSPRMTKACLDAVTSVIGEA